MFNDTGTEIMNLSFKNNPQKLSVCRSTGRIAVVCEKGIVHVLDDKHQLMFKHELSANTDGGKQKMQNPIHAAFNTSRHLLVADGRSPYVHAIDAVNGEPISTVLLVDQNVLPVQCVAVNRIGDVLVAVDTTIYTLVVNATRCFWHIHEDI